AREFWEGLAGGRTTRGRSVGAGSARTKSAQKRERERRKEQCARREPAAPAEAVDREGEARDAGGLAEIERRRKHADRGAARLRRHLRRVGLQRVVQHVEAEPDERDGERRDPPGRREGEDEVR